MPGFYMLLSTKKRDIKFNFQNNRLNTTNLTGSLYKIEKNKIILTVDNRVLE